MTRFPPKGPALMRHVAMASLAVLLSLSTASLAGTPTNARSSAPARQAAPHPLWPDNGIAQRRFPGAFNMFVENDHGKRHAWVMSGLGAHDAKALDFFSGKEMKVTAQLDEDTQQQDFSFTDAAGNDHFPRGTKFEVESTRDLPNGLARSLQNFDLEAAGCPEGFGAIDGGKATWNSAPKWSKIPIYRIGTARGMSGCPNGAYLSGFDSTLDLGDGTFLIKMGCWIFRLRTSDLMPVGSAPALRIVDAASMKKVIDQAKGMHLKDAATYFNQALHLDIDDANSCK